MSDLPGSIKRPRSVTFVAVVAWISGALGVLGGLAIIALTAVATSTGQTVEGIPYTMAVIAIVTGLVTVILARWLLRASPTARMVIAFVQVISIVSTGVGILLGNDLIAAVVGILFSLLTLYLLYAGKAGRYFGTTPAYLGETAEADPRDLL
jgi:hypothetical protein